MHFIYYICQILERTGDQCDMKKWLLIHKYINEIGRYQ